MVHQYTMFSNCIWKVQVRLGKKNTYTEMFPLMMLLVLPKKKINTELRNAFVVSSLKLSGVEYFL